MTVKEYQKIIGLAAAIALDSVEGVKFQQIAFRAVLEDMLKRKREEAARLNKTLGRG
jgi:hypothetical protein